MTSVQVKEKSGFIRQKLLTSDGLEQGSYVDYGITFGCPKKGRLALLKIARKCMRLSVFRTPSTFIIFTIIDISIRIFNISSCVSSHHLFLHKVASLNSQIKNIVKCSNVIKPKLFPQFITQAKVFEWNCFPCKTLRR